ncbi:MAG: 23S rRNA (pseudouridine(1915)-N(3))-methyltransferase RlmH [Coriobacteriia bacterium]
MKIDVVAVGRLKERYWREAADEYLKRLRPYASVRVVEITDRDPGRGGSAKALAEEGAGILDALRPASHVIALELGGTPRSSEEFAARLAALGLDGDSDVTFVIGGSLGLASEVSSRADETLSLGRMTLPHNLARIVLLEQLYRCFRINRGEPYHK